MTVCGTAGRARRAVAMLTGERVGLGRRAFDDCFEMGDGGQVASAVLSSIEASADLARSVYFGKRSYRPAYKGDYAEVHYASSYMSPDWIAAVVKHGVISIDYVNNTYGTRDKVAAILEGGQNVT